MIAELKTHVLFNYDWLHAKLSAMSLHDVLADLNLARQMALHAGLDLAESDVRLLTSALRVGGTHVAENPDTLAFDLIGRLLFYYDHHDANDGLTSMSNGWYKVLCLIPLRRWKNIPC